MPRSSASKTNIARCRQAGGNAPKNAGLDAEEFQRPACVSEVRIGRQSRHFALRGTSCGMMHHRLARTDISTLSILYAYEARVKNHKKFWTNDTTQSHAQ